MNLDFFIEEEQYIQSEPLELDKFISYCKDRGLSITKSQLEYFEKKKLFFPILRIKRPKYKEKIERISKNEIKRLGALKPRERYKGEICEKYSPIYFEKECLTYLKENRFISVPKNKFFIPWKKFSDSKLGETSHLTFYSQFQIYWLYELLRSLKIELGIAFFDNLAKRYKELYQIKRCLKSFEKSFLSNIEDYYRLVEILISIHNRYLPYTKSDQRNILVTWPITHLNWNWHEFARKWDSQKIKNKLLIDSAFIKRWCQKLISQAEYIDPIKDWRTFIQFFSFEKRKLLKGKALLAQDFYAMAKMLEMFYEDLTQEVLADQRLGNKWQENYYGCDTLKSKIDFLEYLSNEYHTNPRPKLILFVEGDSEFENIPRIAKKMGLDFNTTGIRIENLKGIGEYRKLDGIIDHYHHLQTVVYILLTYA